jgi:hypothetical protein
VECENWDIIAEQEPIVADGTVRVICISKLSISDYCDQKPAERPLAISALTPANGSFLAPGQPTNFRVNLGYSDEFRAIANVEFALTYQDTANQPQTSTQIATLASGNGNDGIWSVALAVPADAALDPTTGTQAAELSIRICDNHGQQTGNPDDTACWTYRNLTYLLRDLPTCTDTAFVFDTTSSMGPILGDVQAAATEIVAQLFAANPNARVAVVEYRDGEFDAFGARTVIPFSTDQSAIVAAINGLGISGGGDLPEFVFSGVTMAVELSWREAEDKAIVLIGDDEAKDPEPLTGYTNESTTAATNAKGIAIYSLPQGSLSSFEALANGTGGRTYPIDGYASTVAAIQAACNLP